MEMARKIILYLIENQDVIVPLIGLLAGAGVTVASHFAGKSMRLSDIDDVILDFAKTVGRMADEREISIQRVTMELLPKEIAAKTSRTLEQAAKCIAFEDGGMPKLDKLGALEVLRDSGDVKKLNRKFRKWIKKI